MLKAVKLNWPNTKVQRCQFHVKMNAKVKLTSNPKTDAGKEL
jgi:transposase-like protein